MELIYTIVGDIIRIDGIKEAQPQVVIPPELEGRRVTELGAYALSGSDVEEIYLPPWLEKVGAYGFYGCEKLRRIYCYGRVLDLGAGLFAGVHTVELLDITEFVGEKSCFKDMLSEFRHTLRVRVRRITEDALTNGDFEQIRSGDAGAFQEARLIFPEYYEESVENTPARILFVETHGCGHRYRYCFSGREFQYTGYDELFSHVKVQESEELVTELALGRLLFPCGLTDEHRVMYMDYVREHWRTAGVLMARAGVRRFGQATNLEPGRIPWLVQTVLEGAECRTSSAQGGIAEQITELISIAQQAGDTELVSWLMDYRYHRGGAEAQETTRKRRFEL